MTARASNLIHLRANRNATQVLFPLFEKHAKTHTRECILDQAQSSTPPLSAIRKLEQYLFRIQLCELCAKISEDTQIRETVDLTCGRSAILFDVQQA